MNLFTITLQLSICTLCDTHTPTPRLGPAHRATAALRKPEAVGDFLLSLYKRKHAAYKADETTWTPRTYKLPRSSPPLLMREPRVPCFVTRDSSLSLGERPLPPACSGLWDLPRSPAVRGPEPAHSPQPTPPTPGLPIHGSQEMASGQDD